LTNLGYSVLVVEAGPRIGGRARTESSSFTAPVDLGCAWLHQAETNPLTVFAKALNFSIFPHDDSEFHFYRDARRVDSESSARALEALETLHGTMTGHGGEDIALSSLVTGTDWAHTWAKETLAPLDGGADAENMSVAALCIESLTEPNWFTRQGLGQL